MDAPNLAKPPVRDGTKVTIAPVHSDFLRGRCPLSLMGFAGRSLDRLHALKGASSGAGYANHGLTWYAITV